MSTTNKPFTTLIFVLSVVLGLMSTAGAAVFTASGANPAAIQAAVDNFRAALGPNNGIGGSFSGGRREINWDGVPDAFAAPNNLPANFFNVNSPRGVVFSTPGTGLQVSANAASGTPVRFGNLNAAYPADNQAFSAERLFTALDSNTVQIDFFVPGTNTPAVVSGFGAVFTDVELPGQTIFTLVLGNGASGGQFAVPTGPTGGLSFLGLTDPNSYSRIIIQSGSAVPGTNEVLTNNRDVVFMDDFIYGEPKVVPEPAGIAMAATAICALLIARSRPRG